MQITEPGIYRDFPTDDYFADPCPVPSLTQSIAKILIEKSPLHAMHEHPRLAPATEEDEPAEKYDSAKAIGNAAHAALIGRGKAVAVAPFQNWTTKDARAFRATAEADGLVVILAPHMARAEAMVASARAQIAAHQASDCFTAGAGEVMIAWQEDGTWFRSLIDWLHDDLRTVDDFKTGAVSAAPHTLAYRMVDQGWDVQAAMIERGLDRLDPDNAGRRRFRFIAQENKAPFALSVAELTEAVMTMGRKKLEHAIALWRQSIATNTWPGYPPLVVAPQYPDFRERQWLERELEHEDLRERASENKPLPLDLLMAG